MYVCNIQWTDFVVKASHAPGLYIERVRYHSDWWTKVLKKIEQFFDDYVLPELAHPRIKFGLPRAF